jgi:phage host-nuclease inhibitor protein Gam
MNLYQINRQIEACVDFETGEIIDTERLDALKIERTSKIANVGCWVKNLLAEADAIRAEKNALEERERKARKKAEDLKSWIAEALNGESLKTSRVAISFRKNPPSVEIADERAFVRWAQASGMDDLLTYKEPAANKTAIKQALNGGVDFPGAVIAQKTSISIK